VSLELGEDLSNDYESLDDERFQMLCQSLLAIEYPNVQCMPVGMPDGGRDAVIFGKQGRGSVVFQVKYAKNPTAVEDKAEWVISAVKKELSKLSRLREGGEVEHYVIMTNMPGSSHLDRGSIDKVQKYLEENLPISAQCLWRHDIDIRLEPQVQLKLRYPSLITGSDAVQLLWLLAGSNESQKRRENAIKGYLAHYYDLDSRVRFKEVGLSSNALFDLFVDVPVTVRWDGVERGARSGREKYEENMRRVAAAMRRVAIRRAEIDGGTSMVEQIGVVNGPDGVTAVSYADGRASKIPLGSAALLVDDEFMFGESCIVLEGAPGQGKSTLSQFLMQVQRARILGKTKDLEKLGSEFLSAPLMIPIKMELRDVALWLNGVNPWGAEQDRSHGKLPTLEAAIAGHIERYSGGVRFDVEDLLEMLSEMPCYLVFDALDEVADLDDRRRVIDEVAAGISRLQQRNGSIRSLVTSRPTAIAKSPTFSQENFLYLRLAPIDHELARDYARRWAAARALDQKDTDEIVAVLGQRLASPHIAELAKNTMQLTILLQLISLRGPSLPDKRTALYDAYFDVFMNRESEKNPDVRDNRELLVDMHKYLGFYLHAKAEARRSTGRITTGDLEALIRHYLVKENRPIDLVPTISASVDRIFALVSRIEGTWEFEVQPLQEYFAARFLYDDAPYSPTGREKMGTKPDRFDGIASNPYWLNVTRFFAGCFSKGELMDLSDRVTNLIGSDSTFPRVLAVSLLQDWVFTQNVRATAAVVGAVFDKTGIRWAGLELLYDHGSDFSANLALTRGAETEQMLSTAWPIIEEAGITTQRVRDTCRLIHRQREAGPVVDRWLAGVSEKEGSDRDRWFDIGGRLVVLPKIPADQVARLARAGDPSTIGQRIARLLRADAKIDALTNDELLDGARELMNVNSGFAYPSTEMYGHVWFANPDIWLRLPTLLRYSGQYALESTIPRASGGDRRDSLSEAGRRIAGAFGEPQDGNFRSGPDFIKGMAGITAIMQEIFGPTFIEAEIASMAAAISAHGERGKRASALFDNSRSIVDRVRYARGQLNKPQWWRDQLVDAKAEFDRYLWALTCFAWASPGTLGTLIHDFESVVSSLSGGAKNALNRACLRSVTYSSRAAREVGDSFLGTYRELGDPAAISILWRRFPSDGSADLMWSLRQQEISAPYVADAILCCTAMLWFQGGGGIAPSDMIRVAARCHDAGAFAESGISGLARGDLRSLGVDWAKMAISNNWSMPSDFLYTAYGVLDQGRPNPEAVLKIAERQDWFRGDTWGR
jgi:hypothetical protein